MQRKKILYVDDEPVNISNFTLNFEDKFDILGSASGEEALALFNEHVNDGLAVVVSDQRMPGMSGVELLTRLYEIDPDPVRIILTAYADFDDIQEAVNQAHIFHYVLKPWNRQKLALLLEQAENVFNLTKENAQLLSSLEERNRELQSNMKSLAEELHRRKEEESQRRAAEVRMLAQAKLASLGEMATGVAHEINQPLSYLQVMLQATKRDLEEKRLDHDELLGDLETSLDEVGRIAKIVDQLRTFGRASAGEAEMINLPQMLDNALVPLKHRLKMAEISLNIKAEDTLPAIRGNATRLQQIFINLVSNAMDALRDTAQKEITITMKQDEDRLLTEVTDNGCGMDNEVAARIFEPFFTTKAVGKGTGIGLSIVYGIVGEHNGSIKCTSRPGDGTTFVISLPAGERRRS